ncbi:mediator of RNA polymerase II transcription subunit 15a-like isoform X2 [Populus nigra]|uniref:mediator of RNA polymerase II transcription subunit 15a-like isoform X2 n=1 Tax=Populus nigra TaxID=3691 RepID=UPI002B2791C9|nr:mediator of RNA polymerase II transcription subunit 15a-like isoform X2 [Populus nigra]
MICMCRMETLKRHLLFSGQEGLQELKKFAIRFEEKIHTTATNQYDYLRKISLEMLSMEIRSQNTMPTAPMDPAASHSMPPEVQNQGLFLPILLSTDQSQARQQLVSHNMQNCMACNGVQSYAGLQAALPPVSGVTQTIPNTVVQNPNMQSIPGVSQNSVGNSMGQGIPSTMFANSQRQMPASLDSTAQTGHAKGIDWQEEFYQKEWLRVHGDHVKSEAVEKAITQIMMGEEAEEISSRAKKRPGRLLKKVDLLAPISML